MVYGSDKWTLTTTMIQKLQTERTSLDRISLGIMRLDKKSKDKMDKASNKGDECHIAHKVNKINTGKTLVQKNR